MKAQTRWIPAVLLVGVVAVATITRVWGAWFGIEYGYRPHEPMHITIALNMLKTGNPNPHWFGYPSLLYYILTVVYIPYYLVGVSQGLFRSLEDMVPPQQVFVGGAHVAYPTMFLAGRAPIILMSILGVLLVYLIGRRLANNTVGLMAAAFLALSPIDTLPSHFIQPNSPATFFVLLAFYACLYVYDTGRRRSYLIAGFLGGLSVAAKYNAAPVVLVLVAAHLLRPGKRVLWDDNLLLGLAACGLGFFAGSPYTFLDLPTFLNSIGPALHIYAAGDVGSMGNPLLASLKLLTLHTEGILPLLALAGGVWIVRRRDRAGWLVLVFAISYFLLTAPFQAAYERTHMPLVPFLDLLAAMGIYLTAAAAVAHRPALRRQTVVLAAAVALLAAAYPAVRTVQRDYYLSQEDIRTTAARWIEQNVPERSKVYEEAFSPVLDPARYEVLSDHWAGDRSVPWLKDQGVQYVVLNEANYGNLAQDPASEARWRQYQTFFRDLILVREFRGPFQERIGSLSIYAIP